MLNRLKDTKCFLLDMDGTFYLGGKLIPGSLEFIKTLEAKKIGYMFLTNNSSRSVDYYIKKLEGMGLTVTADKVISSGQATASYLLKQFSCKRIYLLGNQYLVDEMSKMGVVIDNNNPELVVVGYDTTIDYEKMTAVCDLIRAGLPYIATHPDFNCPTEGGFAPDIGAIMAFIEASTGRKADTIIGKPYQGIVDYALERTGHSVEELAMVGDRLYTDVETGLQHGMLAILVMSGETTRDMLATSSTVPHLVFDNLKAIGEAL